MKILTLYDWKERAKVHYDRVKPIIEAFLHRRSRGQKHPVHDFLFTYYNFSPSKLMEWVPSFEESLRFDNTAEITCFNEYWFEVIDGNLQLNPKRLRGQAMALVAFIEELCKAISAKTPRFGCFGLHEWAMVYRLKDEEVRHTGYRLRLSPEELARFVESQNLCCTHYDAFRFFTPQSKCLNVLQPTIQRRIQNEQAGCVHVNMDLYKWATKLWPWIGSDFIAKAFLIALEGRELDMRASPYDLIHLGYNPICIETENGRKEYQLLQQQYTHKTVELRSQLASFCERLQMWKSQY